MLRKIATLPRLLLMLIAVAAALGCDSDQVRRTSDQTVGRVAPIFIFVDVTASRSSITAGEEENPIKITVFAVFADTGEPVTGSANLSTTLGGFDSVGGPSSLNVTLENGIGEANFFPGDTAGTARIRASVQGVIDQVTIEIRPFVEPIPPPTASSITLASNKTTANEADASTVIALEATVVGSNAEPFENAPVQFSAPLGMFDSSGSSSSDILTTDADGKVTETLTITQAELQAFGGSSFDITATLFMEGGAQTSSSVTINIVSEPTAEDVILTVIPSASINDDGTLQSRTLRATVTDGNGDPIEGVTVTFGTGLGAITPASQTDATDTNGIAEVTLDVTASEVANFCAATFQVSASISGDSDSETITISRVPLNASFTYVANSSTETDFTDTTTGGPLSWDWDFNDDGTVDSTDQSPQDVDLTAFGFGVGTTDSVRLTVHRGTCTTDFALQSVTNGSP
jgi:hypothetical protein